MGDTAVPVIAQYVESDGTVVRRHARLQAGVHREGARGRATAAGVLILGNSNTVTTEAERQPTQFRLPRQGLQQPQSPVAYSIKRLEWNKPAELSTPTAAYASVFPSLRSGR